MIYNRNCCKLLEKAKVFSVTDSLFKDFFHVADS